MFDGFKIEKGLAQLAYSKAEINWNWWREDYLHTARFAEMPVFQSYPRFRGFGADYSVFRGLNADQCEDLRQWFLRQNDPVSFSPVFQIFMKFISQSPGSSGRSQNRVSLVSKLLCMWKPKEFAMWDGLARKGLKSAHGSQRGHRYTATNAKTFEVFNSDFFALLKVVETDLEKFCAEIELPTTNPKPAEIFIPRVMDNYLMLVEN